jgi:hypothetical protein
MQYALLIYGHPTQKVTERPIEASITAVLDRPYVDGWARLHADGSATTVRKGASEFLLTDGPFVETKEFLSGIIVIEADDLDTAIEVAQELLPGATSAAAIEVRPVRQSLFRGA